MLQKNETRALQLDASTRGLYEFLCFQATLQGSHEIKASYQALANSNHLQRSHAKSIIKRLVAMDAIRVEIVGRQTKIFVPAQDPPTEKQIRALVSLRRLDPAMKDPATKEEARLLIRRLLKLQKDEQEAKKDQAPAPAPKQKEEELEQEEQGSTITLEMMQAARAELEGSL